MAQPARKRRPRLPPGVVDIGAPQFPLPHTPPPPTTTNTTTIRARELQLTDEERALAGQLRDLYKFRGAAQFIARHGFENVVWALQLAAEETDVKHPGRFIRWLLDTAEERAG